MSARPFLERASWVAGIVAAVIAAISLKYQVAPTPPTKETTASSSEAASAPTQVAPAASSPLSRARNAASSAVDQARADATYRSTTFWDKLKAGNFESIRIDLTTPIYKFSPTLQYYKYTLAMAEGNLEAAVTAMSLESQRDDYPSMDSNHLYPKWPSLYWTREGLSVRSTDGTQHLFENSRFPSRTTAWNKADWTVARRLTGPLQGPNRNWVDVRMNLLIEGLEPVDVDRLIQAMYLQGKASRVMELLNLLMTVDLEGSHSEVELTAIELALLQGNKQRAHELFSGTGKTPDHGIQGRYDPAQTCVYESFTTVRPSAQLEAISRCRKVIAEESGKQKTASARDLVLFRPLLDSYVYTISNSSERENLSKLLVEFKALRGSSHLFNWIGNESLRKNRS
jgi:hypothetical protein